MLPARSVTRMPSARRFERGCEFGSMRSASCVFGAPALAAVVQHHDEQVLFRAHRDAADAARDGDGDAVEAAQPGLGLDVLGEAGRSLAPEDEVFGGRAQLDDLAAAQRPGASTPSICPAAVLAATTRRLATSMSQHGVEHAVDQAGGEFDSGERKALQRTGSFHAIASSCSLAVFEEIADAQARREVVERLARASCAAAGCGGCRGAGRAPGRACSASSRGTSRLVHDHARLERARRVDATPPCA